MTIKGGCLCGNVRYEIIGQLLTAHHCQCSMCRRQHGAAFSTYAELNPDDFMWISGEEFVTTYEGLQVGGWCFCSEYGSTLAGTDKGKITLVTLGPVTGGPSLKPDSHIFVGSKAHWHKICDDQPQFEDWPTDNWEPSSKTQ